MEASKDLGTRISNTLELAFSMDHTSATPKARLQHGSSEAVLSRFIIHSAAMSLLC